MKLQNSFFITCIILISAHCSYGAQKCYKEWADLASDLFDVAHDASFTGGSFTLCKNTIFNIESSLKIWSSNVVIECEEEECVVNGGTYQIFITEGLYGPPTGVQLRGITFSSAEVINVIAYGSENMQIDVVNCKFEGSIKSTTIGIFASGANTNINVLDSLFTNNIYMAAVGAGE